MKLSLSTAPGLLLLGILGAVRTTAHGWQMKTVTSYVYQTKTFTKTQCPAKTSTSTSPTPPPPPPPPPPADPCGGDILGWCPENHICTADYGQRTGQVGYSCQYTSVACSNSTMGWCANAKVCTQSAQGYSCEAPNPIWCGANNGNLLGKCPQSAPFPPGARCRPLAYEMNAGDLRWFGFKCCGDSGCRGV